MLDFYDRRVLQIQEFRIFLMETEILENVQMNTGHK